MSEPTFLTPSGSVVAVFTPDPQPLEWSALWSVLRANYAAGRVAWVETTEAMYDAMLNVLPPRRQVSGGFLVGEPYTHTDRGEAVYAAFTLRAGRFEACYPTVAEFRRLVGVIPFPHARLRPGLSGASREKRSDARDDPNRNRLLQTRRRMVHPAGRGQFAAAIPSFGRRVGKQERRDPRLGTWQGHMGQVVLIPLRISFPNSVDTDREPE